jgi:hypothetical protein
MSNWFEANQTKSVIIYTAFVAGITWACFNFILDENKVNYYRAETASAKSTADTLQAKISIIESENNKLRSDTERYLHWLQSDPKSIPSAEKRIAELTAEVASLRTKAAPVPVNGDVSMVPLIGQSNRYIVTERVDKGKSFVDPKTGARVGVNGVSPNFSFQGVLTLPGGGVEVVTNLKPGEVREFSRNGKTYTLGIDEVNFLNDSVVVSVVENE